MMQVDRFDKSENIDVETTSDRCLHLPKKSSVQQLSMIARRFSTYM
jgi:hypothetical protein